MSYPEAPDHTGIAPKHKEAAERAKAGEANNTPMKKPKKLTASQKEKIEELKAVFGYEHKGLKNISIETGEYFASVTGNGNDGYHFFAMIGVKGALKHLTVRYPFMGEHEYKKDEAERHIRFTLIDMKKAGLWKWKHKERPEVTIYGISFYNVDKSGAGLIPIGVNRNAITEKYFIWAFPKGDIYGTIFDYAYIPNGGEGILLVDIPEREGKPDGYGTPDNRERISFYYEPRHVLSVRKTGYEEDLSKDTGRGRTEFSKRFGMSLTNRQIIAKVFKAWLDSKGLL